MQRPAATARQYDDARAYGIKPGAARDNGGALARADAAGYCELPRGSYRVGTDRTLSGAWDIRQGGELVVEPGKTVTLNNDLSARRERCFVLPDPPPGVERGRVLMPGQRSPIYPEWWGGSLISRAGAFAEGAFDAAHDALTKGGTIECGNGHYIFNGPLKPRTNRVRMKGAGRGHNPQEGGTYLQVSPTFAHTEQAFITHIAGSIDDADYLIGCDNTDKLNRYTAIRLVNSGDFQPGKCTLDNIEINGCGIGVDFGVGNTGSDYDVRIYNFRTAGRRYGGVIDPELGVQNSGPWRSYSALINNANFTGTTAGAVNDDDQVDLLDAGGVIVGMEITFDGVTILEVLGKAGNTLTLSAPITVGSGAVTRFGWHMGGTCVELLGNAFDIYLNYAEFAGGKHWLHFKGTNGMALPNALELNSANFTVAGAEGVLVEKGLNISIMSCWLGDTPWGSVVKIAAAGDNPANAEGVSLEGSAVGGGGRHGIEFGCGTNLAVLGGHVIGNSLSDPETFNNIYVGPDAAGVLRVVGSRLDNGPQDSLQGQAAYPSVNIHQEAALGETILESNVELPAP